MLVLGFVVVAVSGLVYRYRGARTAGLLLVVAALASLAMGVWAGGREGVGELAVGGLTGLPVLIGGALVRGRDTRAGAPRVPPA